MDTDFTLLNKINNPDDLKRLNISELEALAGEIRRFLVLSVSETGGHLSSNLGVTELTIALHYCFNTPRDKIIWDVGHQSYVHKILTGRRNAFHTLRTLDGLSGFPKTSESEYDAFDTGHASTSVSAAYGMAVARDISGGSHRVIAVIGDGAMTGGLAYEALNNAGRQDTDLTVILNDNEMSISKNVGAISRHLSEIRTRRSYISAKEEVKGLIAKIPLIGKPLQKLVFASKNMLKRIIVRGGIFDAMGFNYIGPIDGHNLQELVTVLGRVGEMKGPVLVHVFSKKGKGYDKAETSPDGFHGVSSFNVDTGKPNGIKSAETFTDVFGSTLVKLAGINKKIVAVTAAMPDGTGLSDFRQVFPERFFDVGIAEGHAVTFCSGLASQGVIPVFAVYSTFLQRGYDQLLHDVCLQNLHVVFAVDRAGIVGPDGETHQGIFDLSYLLHMPNMTVLCPKSPAELAEMLDFAVSLSGPVAVRYPRGGAPEISGGSEGMKPENLLKAETILEGDEIAVVSIGSMLEHAHDACGMLVKEGLRPALINARAAKPLDTEMLVKLKSCRHVFTVEDNCTKGGFGASLAEELHLICGGQLLPVVHNLGFPSKFIEHGSRSQLFSRYGLDGRGIYNAVMKMAAPDICTDYKKNI